MDIEPFELASRQKKSASVRKTERESTNMRLTNIQPNCDTSESDSSQEETVEPPVAMINHKKESVPTKESNPNKMKQQKIPFRSVKSTINVKKNNLQPLSRLKTPEILSNPKARPQSTTSILTIESSSEETLNSSKAGQELSRKRKSVRSDPSVIEVANDSNKGISLNFSIVCLADDAISYVGSSSSRGESSKMLSQSLNIQDADELNSSKRSEISKQSNHPAAPSDAEMSSDDQEERSPEIRPQKPNKSSKNALKQGPIAIQRDSSTDLEVDDPFFKYDPKDNGCQRDGLRIRKHSRVWWLPCPPDDIAIIYKNPTRREMEIEEEARQIIIEKKIKLKDIKPNFIDTFMQPRECLKRVKAIAKELDRIPPNFLKGKTSVKDPKNISDFDEFTKKIKDSVPEDYANNEEIFKKGKNS